MEVSGTGSTSSSGSAKNRMGTTAHTNPQDVYAGLEAAGVVRLNWIGR